MVNSLQSSCRQRISKYIHPTESDARIDNPLKVVKALNWKVRTRWKELAELMIDADIKAALSPLGY